jgi:hypothetical protein
VVAGSLRTMLDVAIERKYSANLDETFYTGGSQSANVQLRCIA